MIYCSEYDTFLYIRDYDPYITSQELLQGEADAIQKISSSKSSHVAIQLESVCSKSKKNILTEALNKKVDQLSVFLSDFTELQWFIKVSRQSSNVNINVNSEILNIDGLDIILKECYRRSKYGYQLTFNDLSYETTLQIAETFINLESRFKTAIISILVTKD
ncbi:hypothetical protein TetV_245 [Tetraselmis virus 1]|uniref:Uncharacterized protein n=1 Tax=Tetraselmis virus 1 TaxID=2060617 RepID=A0A2P0VN42_9VIRU|nr:hypothetical protein QJ968_gp245 [Tetraselmis virus 1]AUF82337.1 hypothetical protein TetV_245 [Tetraselmis virus 1]